MGMEFSVLRIRDTKLCMLECWYLSDAMKEKNTLEIAEEKRSVAKRYR